tara:strand:- start:60 stop:1247 length:1188 start_codon:yes stop_codon:yes gene_type:complete
MSTTKKILSILIFASLIFEISRFYSFVNNQSSWQYVDWLINYEGGLVRRGLIGHILFELHNLLYIDLDILVFLFVSLIYIFLSFCLFKSIKYIEKSKLNIIIFLSPAFFIYPIMNSGIIGRKDVLFIFFVSFLVFYEKKLNIKLILATLLIGILTTTLSHSGFIFYAPYLILLYFLIKQSRNLKINFLEISLILLTILFSLIFIQLFSGSEQIVENICFSVKEFVSKNCGKSDQILWLTKSLDDRFFEKINMGNNYMVNYFIIYLSSIFISFSFISISLFNSKLNFNISTNINFNPFYILLIIFTLTLPVYIFGRDWGRYIYISYSSIFFIYVYCIKNNLLDFKKNNLIWLNNLSKFKFIILIVIYSFTWTFPFYDAKSFKIVLKKPILNLINKI